MHDLRLIENFKIFVGGPSRCGKTFFVVDFIQNLKSISKIPPTNIIYVYKVWQPKYDEIRKLITVFIQEQEDLLEKIKEHLSDQPTLIVFDDLINSKSLKNIAQLFVVDGRHLNMSLIFLSQRLFVNDEYFRQISGNCDYFCVFKNPRKVNEVRELAKQLTPGTLELLNIYALATKEPYSYLFINLTQECPDALKYTSHLFDYDHYIQIYVDEST
jgi:GTPase SAR1 family protein